MLSASLGNTFGTVAVCLFVFSLLLLAVCLIARAAERNFPRQTPYVLTLLFFLSLTECFFAAVVRCLLYYNPQPSQLMLAGISGSVAFATAYCYAWLSPKMVAWMTSKGRHS